MIPLRLPPLPSIGDLLKLYNLRALKSLSQNFLIDSKLRSKVVSISKMVKGYHIVEVGPGPGGLTRCILEQGAEKIDIIEKDKRFIPILEHLREASHNKLQIHLGDILKFDLAPIFDPQFSTPWEGNIPKMQVIGNLPFSVSTPLIIRWLQDISKRSNAWSHGRVPMTLTFQEEVGERMTSSCAEVQRSRLSIMCQNWCHVNLKFIIPGRAFIPKPDVNVAVVVLIPRIEPIIDLNFKLVERVVFAAFCMRQKYCKRGLSTLFPESVREDLISELLLKAKVNPEKRPFELSLYNFKNLCFAYDEILRKNPQFIKYHYRGQDTYRLDDFLKDADPTTIDVISNIEEETTTHL